MQTLKQAFAVLFLALLPCWAWAEPLDINTATAGQLAETIQGVGQAKAEAIVRDREANGPFQSVDDLERVKGIGKATIQKNKDRLTVTGAPPAPPAPPAPH